MRILQLVTRRQRRGAEVFAAQLADTLAQKGHELLVLGIYPPPANPLSGSSVVTADLTTASSGKLSVSRVQELARAIRSFDPDVVQANGSDTLKYSSLVKKLYRGRWPLIYRNISVASRWLRYPGQRAWGRWLLRSVDHVAAVSEESGADFGRTYRLPPARISVIPIGTWVPESLHPESTRARLAALASIPDSADILVHVGSHSPEKNHLWLLDAFMAIRARRPEAHLVLLGDGPLRPTIEAAIASNERLRGWVHVLGNRPDAGELVGGADVLLLPSLVEGIPGVILEAAAHAVPAVATDVGGIHEAVRRGVTGVLVPLGDREGFVDGVAGLLADPAARARMGAAAREHVREHYDMERVVDAFEHLYERLRRGHAARGSQEGWG
jgi:glycosyltransferase involved in cell wall biosynthesis